MSTREFSQKVLVLVKISYSVLHQNKIPDPKLPAYRLRKTVIFFLLLLLDMCTDVRKTEDENI